MGDRVNVTVLPNTYWWKITAVHSPHAQDGLGKVGPRNADESITANKGTFKIYDDDGEPWYSGEIYGEYDGFEPLDDYGTPNDGCTQIKIDGDWL